MSRLLAGLLLAAAAVGCTGGGGAGLVSPAPLPGESEPGLLDRLPLPLSATREKLVLSGGGRFVATYRVQQPVERVLAFYQTELRRNGWRLTGLDSTELLHEVTFAGNGWAGTLSIVSGTTTQLVVVARPEPTGGG